MKKAGVSPSSVNGEIPILYGNALFFCLFRLPPLTLASVQVGGNTPFPQLDRVHALGRIPPSELVEAGRFPEFRPSSLKRSIFDFALLQITAVLLEKPTLPFRGQG